MAQYEFKNSTMYICEFGMGKKEKECGK